MSSVRSDSITYLRGPWGQPRKVPRDPELDWRTGIANQDVRPQPVAKKIAKASGAEDFNILQNNGRIAHQVVDHVSFSWGFL